MSGGCEQMPCCDDLNRHVQIIGIVFVLRGGACCNLPYGDYLDFQIRVFVSASMMVKSKRQIFVVVH